MIIYAAKNDVSAIYFESKEDAEYYRNMHPDSTGLYVCEIYVISAGSIVRETNVQKSE